MSANYHFGDGFGMGTVSWWVARKMLFLKKEWGGVGRQCKYRTTLVVVYWFLAMKRQSAEDAAWLMTLMAIVLNGCTHKIRKRDCEDGHNQV
ncbi:MAG: hypothetical protein FWD76_04720 [Firmicutes bacterium]|nr:hypothetical protein [Bacillota bacterium]